MKIIFEIIYFLWYYRVGDYRLFADIEDEIVTIFIFEIGHRKEIYK